MKQLTLNRLNSDKANLEEQYKRLKAQCSRLQEQAIMVKGAIKYIDQTISKLTGE